MPRWARFLSCSVTGLFIALLGFFAGAWWLEGGPGFWQEAFDFVGTPAFWFLLWLFAALSVAALVVARLAVYVYRVTALPAGLLAGTVVSLIYIWFVVATHARDWGGLWLGLKNVWPSAGLFLLPFAVAAAFTNWLWDRLD